MTTIMFVVDGVRGKGRARATLQGKKIRFFKPALDRKYEGAILSAWHEALGSDEWDLTRTMSVDIEVHDTPKMYMGQPRMADIDNVAKIVLDALNKIAYRDDIQVDRLTVVRKPVSPKGRCVWVRVTLGEPWAERLDEYKKANK